MPSLMNKNLRLFRVVEVPRAISSALVHFVLHAANNQRSRNLIVQDFVKGVCKYELKRLKCCGLNYMQRQELVDPVANRPTLQITAFRLYSHSIPPIFVIKSMPKCRVLKRIDGQWCLFWLRQVNVGILVVILEAYGTTQLKWV